MSDQFKDKVSREIFSAYREFYLEATAAYRSVDPNWNNIGNAIQKARARIEAAASEAIMDGLTKPEDKGEVKE